MFDHLFACTWPNVFRLCSQSTSLSLSLPLSFLKVISAFVRSILRAHKLDLFKCTRLVKTQFISSVYFKRSLHFRALAVTPWVLYARQTLSQFSSPMSCNPCAVSGHSDYFLSQGMVQKRSPPPSSLTRNCGPVSQQSFVLCYRRRLPRTKSAWLTPL